jgi:hypothetical protein
VLAVDRGLFGGLLGLGPAPRTPAVLDVLPRPAFPIEMRRLLGDREEAVPVYAEQIAVVRPALPQAVIQASTTACVTPCRPTTNRAIISIVRAL